MTRPKSPGVGGADYDRAIQFLHVQKHVRTVRLPEPVVVPAMVNGRPLRGWERVLYREWAAGERRRELAMFGGLIG